MQIFSDFVILTERSVGTFRSTPVGAEVKDLALGRRGMKASVNLQFPSFAPRHRLSKLISALGLASVATATRYDSVACDEWNFSSSEERALAPLGLSPPRSFSKRHLRDVCLSPTGRRPKGSLRST